MSKFILRNVARIKELPDNIHTTELFRHIKPNDLLLITDIANQCFVENISTAEHVMISDAKLQYELSHLQIQIMSPEEMLAFVPNDCAIFFCYDINTAETIQITHVTLDVSDGKLSYKYHAVSMDEDNQISYQFVNKSIYTDNSEKSETHCVFNDISKNPVTPRMKALHVPTIEKPL